MNPWWPWYNYYLSTKFLPRLQWALSFSTRYDCPTSQFWFQPKPLEEGEKMVRYVLWHQYWWPLHNHSLWTTGVSELFAVGLPKALMQKRTGHCSLESLRLYETQGVQEELNLNILAGKAGHLQRNTSGFVTHPTSLISNFWTASTALNYWHYWLIVHEIQGVIFGCVIQPAGVAASMWLLQQHTQVIS